MGSVPAYEITPRSGRAVLSAACTDKTGATTTNIVDIALAHAGPTQIYEIVCQSDGRPADCLVLIFRWNGTDYRLYDEFDAGAPAAGSTTVTSWREPRKYDNLWLPTSTWKLAAAITVVPTTGNVNVFADGAEL